MNDINDTPQIIYYLNNRGLYTLDKLAKWNRIIGIIFIVTGIISLLGIFADGSNLALVIFTIVFSILIVFLGTRLTGAATNIKQAMIDERSDSLQVGLDNLRQYFMITGIAYFVGFILMILFMLVGAFFGFESDNFYSI